MKPESAAQQDALTLVAQAFRPANGRACSPEGMRCRHRERRSGNDAPESAPIAFMMRLAVAIAFAAGCVVVAQPGASFDIVVRNGTVVDGSGGARYRADVGIAGGAVVRIGNLSAERAAVEIDATGLYVAPGFINIHSHAST